MWERNELRCLLSQKMYWWDEWECQKVWQDTGRVERKDKRIFNWGSITKGDKLSKEPTNTKNFLDVESIQNLISKSWEKGKSCTHVEVSLSSLDD